MWGLLRFDIVTVLEIFFQSVVKDSLKELPKTLN